MTCTGCGERFSGIGAFDKHQRWHPKRRRVVCSDPEQAGLCHDQRFSDVTVWSLG